MNMPSAKAHINPPTAKAVRQFLSTGDGGDALLAIEPYSSFDTDIGSSFLFYYDLPALTKYTLTNRIKTFKIKAVCIKGDV